MFTCISKAREGSFIWESRIVMIRYIFFTLDLDEEEERNRGSVMALHHPSKIIILP